MKKTILATTLAAWLGTLPFQVNAGAMTNSATESTQLLNNFQLVVSYAKQVEQYTRQGLQYKTQLQNLILAESPGITDVLTIVNNIGQMMSAGKAIGGSMAEIDRNFANTFKSATAANFADDFTKWNNTGLDTLQAALKAAGKHRDQYPSDAAMLQDLYAKSQTTMGARDSIQMVAAINAEQVNQMHKLSSLLSAQNIATSTYMANMTDQSQASIAADQAIRKGLKDAANTPDPKLDTSKKTYTPINFNK